MSAAIRVLIGASLVGLSGLQGCATVGENDFACPGRPSGVRCASALEVYRATEGTEVIAATAGEALGDDPDKAARRLASEMGEASNTRVSGGASRGDTPDGQSRAVPSTPYAETDPRLIRAGTAGIVPLVDKPIPVRTPAQVMRVWLAPWEDERGVFHVGGYSFIEVEARRWTLGEPAVAEPVRFFSIQDAAAESTEPDGEGPSVRGERLGTTTNR